MNYNDKLAELYKYIQDFKKEFAEIENLNPSYISITIDDSNNITVIPTNDSGMIYGYRY